MLREPNGNHASKTPPRKTSFIRSAMNLVRSFGSGAALLIFLRFEEISHNLLSNKAYSGPFWEFREANLKTLRVFCVPLLLSIFGDERQGPLEKDTRDRWPRFRDGSNRLPTNPDCRMDRERPLRVFVSNQCARRNSSILYLRPRDGEKFDLRCRGIGFEDFRVRESSIATSPQQDATHRKPLRTEAPVAPTLR